MTNYPLIPERVLCIKAETGEDLLAVLQKSVNDLGIRNGVIVNGIGSIRSFHVHVIESDRIPPGNVFTKGSGPYDLNSVQGFIIEGRVHAHIVLSNSERTVGGHLESGTTAHTFCIVTVMDTSGSSLEQLDYFVGKRVQQTSGGEHEPV
jgi:uncharacterized protein